MEALPPGSCGLGTRLTKGKARGGAAAAAVPQLLPGSWAVLYGDDAATLLAALRADPPLPAPTARRGPWSLPLLLPQPRCLGVILEPWDRPAPAFLAAGFAPASWLWARAARPSVALELLQALVATPQVRRVVVREMGELAALPQLLPGSRGGVPQLLQHCRCRGVDVVGCMPAWACGPQTGHLPGPPGVCAQFAAWASVRAQTC